MTATRTLAEETAFATSGSTGEPVVWMRTRRQLDAEASLLRAVLGPFEQVLSFAPPEHLYGRLLGRVLPRATGAPVLECWSRPLDPPLPPPGKRTLLVCLPSTWTVLRSLVPALRDLPGVTAVHSSGPPVPAAFDVAAALAGDRFRLVELLGATETGAIARRDLAPEHRDPPWELLDDVTADLDGPEDRRLTVAGPRLARRSDLDRAPATHTLDDVIRPLGPRRFERIGRSSGLIKINGRRYQLERFEAALREAFPGRDFACVATADDVRAEHYEVYHSDLAGHPDAEAIRAGLRRLLPGSPPPRRVHRVERLPASAAGKTRISELPDRRRDLE